MRVSDDAVNVKVVVTTQILHYWMTAPSQSASNLIHLFIPNNILNTFEIAVYEP